MYAIVALACYFAAGILILKRQLAGGPETHPHGIGPALLLGAAGLAIHSISLGGLVGRMQILELREEAKKRLGARYDRLDFHAALLAGGTLPPALIGEELWERLGVD